MSIDVFVPLPSSCGSNTTFVKLVFSQTLVTFFTYDLSSEIGRTLCLFILLLTFIPRTPEGPPAVIAPFFAVRAAPPPSVFLPRFSGAARRFFRASLLPCGPHPTSFFVFPQFRALDSSTVPVFYEDTSLPAPDRISSFAAKPLRFLVT